MTMALTLLAALLLFQMAPMPGPGGVPTPTGISFGNSCGNDTLSSGSSLATSNGACTFSTGSAVVCMVGWGGNGATAVPGISSVSDGTNTYTPITGTGGGAGGQVSTGTWAGGQFAYAKNITGGSLTITVTLSSSSADGMGFTCQEIKNANTSSPLDFIQSDNASLAGLETGTLGNPIGSGLSTSFTPEAVILGCGFDRHITGGISVTNGNNLISASPNAQANIYGRISAGAVSGETDTWALGSTGSWYGCSSASFH